MPAFRLSILTPLVDAGRINAEGEALCSNGGEGAADAALILIKARRPCALPARQKQAVPAAGQAALPGRGSPGGEGAASGFGFPGAIHPALLPGLCPARAASPAGTGRGDAARSCISSQNGSQKEGEPEIGAPLCREPRGGTNPAQPHPCSIVATRHCMSICLGQLLACFGCFFLTQLPISTFPTAQKTHLFFKIKGERKK